MAHIILSLLLAAILALVLFVIHLVYIGPRSNPLRQLPGPPSHKLYDNSHMFMTMDAGRSRSTHEKFVKEYGRSVHIRGPLPWDDRLFTMDPVSMNHILKNPSIYEKPWYSRDLIASLLGRGMLASEGQMHKRQRRVATPAFSIQNLRALVPLVFSKGVLMRDKWQAMFTEAGSSGKGLKLDVCDWMSRTTFDVMGSAGFQYQFNALDSADNELLHAYKEMFEVGISQQGGSFRMILFLYFPFLRPFIRDHRSRTVDKCKDIIYRVAGQLIQERKQKIQEAEEVGKTYDGKDLLTLLLKANQSTDIAPEQRISDEDILHTINTFMFAGSDSTSIALTWTLLLLGMHPIVQETLRAEILSVLPSTPIESLTEEEIDSFYAIIADLPYLDKVCRESLRLIPPVHSSLRAATQDDVIPTSSPLKFKQPDGTVREEMRSIRVPKGSPVHIAVEAFNLDKEVWGPDAWAFVPDRWDNLPEAVASNPGVYANTMTFSAGPRACIGMRFSIIEMKCVLYILLSHFSFAPSEEKIAKANVVVTRPYIVGKSKEGSKCPMIVTPYVRESPP
ncbi:cytochrome P450 [Cristinia sonorae]|uniref:Cytochrome P450 n=1 Tax=Cristinia sonorae TaxID=1940300 RepID=A0A8K0XRT1_9AGAR|nr:cytochrome P450 [Cristinia sonorae]